MVGSVIEDLDGSLFLGFSDGILSPGSRYDVLSGRFRASQQIHRHHGKLQASSSLKEEDFMGLGDLEQSDQPLLGLFLDGNELLAAVGDL